MLLVSFIMISGLVTDARNEVHEWGVVVFEENMDPAICGSPWNEAAMSGNSDVLAEAPVVWIHGEPFEGTFTIEIESGETITMIYPEPDSLVENRASWELSASTLVTNNTEEAILYEGPFWWAADFWRDVPSLTLLQKNTGITENFLYYECTVNPAFAEIFFHWDSGGTPVFTGIPVDDALAFTPYGIVQVALRQDSFVPNDFPFQGITQPEQVLDTFRRWAGSKLKTSEITALWETWMPAFIEGGQYWLVFPIPEEYNNSISTIHLETYDNRAIEYHRLFLGAVRVTLQ
ncbi:MAG: hypothetical protein KAH54_01190 [Candidatus Sabulitectum sp.]|nr:hypothetical protein [Candidatus Sabulitectum sp.]